MLSSAKTDRDFDRMIDFQCQRLESHVFRKFRDQLRLDLEKSRLGFATGITDGDLIDKLHAHGLRDDNLTAFLFLPVAMAGWADGVINRQEVLVANQAFESLEPAPSPEARELFSSWLTQRPSQTLMEYWEQWIGIILDREDPDSLYEFLRAIAWVTEKVASASGGFLGIGKISGSEWAILNRVHRFLNRLRI